MIHFVAQITQFWVISLFVWLSSEENLFIFKSIPSTFAFNSSKLEPYNSNLFLIGSISSSISSFHSCRSSLEIVVVWTWRIIKQNKNRKNILNLTIPLQLRFYSKLIPKSEVHVSTINMNKNKFLARGVLRWPQTHLFVISEISRTSSLNMKCRRKYSKFIAIFFIKILVIWPICLEFPPLISHWLPNHRTGFSFLLCDDWSAGGKFMEEIWAYWSRDWQDWYDAGNALAFWFCGCSFRKKIVSGAAADGAAAAACVLAR